MTILQDRSLRGNSINWFNWMSVLIPTTCMDCAKKHGSIYCIDDVTVTKPPLHFYCKCQLVAMRTVRVGTATEKELEGADSYLYYVGQLPDYYLTIQEARNLGWIAREGNLGIVAPNKMICGGVFANRENKLPSAVGRVWYEADINYISGHRGSDRILFSNDGLIFVTYDHYSTFYEIVG